MATYHDDVYMIVEIVEVVSRTIIMPAPDGLAERYACQIGSEFSILIENEVQEILENAKPSQIDSEETSLESLNVTFEDKSGKTIYSDKTGDFWESEDAD